MKSYLNRKLTILLLTMLVLVAFTSVSCTYKSFMEGTGKFSKLMKMSQSEKKLPKLLDLGSKTCIPCKKMAPILEEMKETYKGKMEIEFIDVKVKTEAYKIYGIKMIPTQIFFDPNGKELYRHMGFYSKNMILKKWKELGYEF